MPSWALALNWQLWITRINIATREHGVSYSRLMHGLVKVPTGGSAPLLFSPPPCLCRGADRGICGALARFLRLCAQADVQLNRKVLSELAIHEPRTFESLAKLANEQHREAGLGLKLLLPQQ
jgi:ribosomal protein L20